MSRRSGFLPGAVALLGPGLAAAAPAQDWQLGLPPPATPVMEQLTRFHAGLLTLAILIAALIAFLLLYVALRFRARANPVPSKAQHHALLETTWTLVPLAILAVVAIPSFALLHLEADMPRPDLTVEAIGRQWYWTYVYPKEGGLQFDSVMLPDAAAKERGEPRLLSVDNPLTVPVNKVVEVVTTGADVIHSWAVPAFGVKMDAIPGRLNRTWFKATKTGTYYGQCSELCGMGHAFMPIEVKVVTEAEYRDWLAETKARFAGGRTLRVAGR